MIVTFLPQPATLFCKVTPDSIKFSHCTCAVPFQSISSPYETVFQTMTETTLFKANNLIKHRLYQLVLFLALVFLNLTFKYQMSFVTYLAYTDEV